MADKKNKRKQIKAAKTAQPSVDIDQISPAASVTQSARAAYDVADIVINPEDFSLFDAKRRQRKQKKFVFPVLPSFVAMTTGAAKFAAAIYAQQKEDFSTLFANFKKPDTYIEPVVLDFFRMGPIAFTRSKLNALMAKSENTTTATATVAEPYTDATITPAETTPEKATTLFLPEDPSSDPANYQLTGMRYDLPLPVILIAPVDQPEVLPSEVVNPFIPAIQMSPSLQTVVQRYIEMNKPAPETQSPSSLWQNLMQPETYLTPMAAKIVRKTAGLVARAASPIIRFFKLDKLVGFVQSVPLNMEKTAQSVLMSNEGMKALDEAAQTVDSLYTKYQSLKTQMSATTSKTMAMPRQFVTMAQQKIAPVVQFVMAPSPFTGTVSSLEDHVRAHVANPTHTALSETTKRGRAALMEGSKTAMAYAAKEEAVAASSAANRAYIAEEYADPMPTTAKPNSGIGARFMTIAKSPAGQLAAATLAVAALSITQPVLAAGMATTIMAYKMVSASRFAQRVAAAGFGVAFMAAPLQSDSNMHAPSSAPTIQTPTMQLAAIGGQNFVQPQVSYAAGPILVSASTLGMTAQAPAHAAAISKTATTPAFASMTPEAQKQIVDDLANLPKAFKQALSAKGNAARTVFDQLPPELQKQISKVSRDMKGGVPTSKSAARQLMHATKEASYHLLRAGNTEANNRAAFDLLAQGSHASKVFDLDNTPTAQQINADLSIMLSGGYKGIEKDAETARSYMERISKMPTYGQNYAALKAEGSSANTPTQKVGARSKATFSMN